jgi:RES domain
MNRLADPAWADPLDTSFSAKRGGRWNAPGTYEVLYLNGSLHTAVIQVRHRLAGQPFEIEDLDPDEQHDLVEVTVPDDDYLDCISDQGLTAVGLPASYPLDRAGHPVGHDVCQPIGARAHAERLPGVACRSAANGADRSDEELAVFDHAAGGVQATARRPFVDWYLNRSEEQ